MYSFIKNKELISPIEKNAHAFAKFRIDAKKHALNIIEEIAIGQSIGSWEERFVDVNILKSKIAKIISYESNEFFHEVIIAFPLSIWQQKLAWLITLLFGKMSFYEGVQLNSVWFSPDCFDSNNLIGPKFTMESIRALVGEEKAQPLLMGILKPNVAMKPEKIAELYVEAAEAGIHFLKDDEIRHDNSTNELLKRVELVAKEAQNRKLKTIYAVHFQIDSSNYLAHAKDLINSGAQAFLVNTWIAGIDVLQELRKLINVPILSHPSLVGAFGTREQTATIHPRVTLAQFTRAAGADFSLFPSPYGQLGIDKSVALDIFNSCLTQNKNWPINPSIPVLSAGIKPEHVTLANKDFGNNYVLNAGTGIFSNTDTITRNIQKFKNEINKL